MQIVGRNWGTGSFNLCLHFYFTISQGIIVAFTLGVEFVPVHGLTSPGSDAFSSSHFYKETQRCMRISKGDMQLENLRETL